MEDLLIQPVQSVVPVLALQPLNNSIVRKYWHIICKAELVIPLGLSVMKINLFLIWFDGRLFLTLVIEYLQMLPAPQENIEYEIVPALKNESSLNSIPLPCGPIPIGMAVFELPQCPRCFLHYSCNAHQEKNV